MFNRKLIIAALAAFAFAPVAAQVQNPGVQQSGAVTFGNCAKWGPGVGQLQDGGACGGGSVTPAAATSANDTNVTLTLTGTPATALLQAVQFTMGWTGTLAAARLNANVVQGVTNDTNVTGTITAQNLTLGWSGVLAAARLNANVVQSVVNDTNIQGSIAAQALTFSWAGTLSKTRGGFGGAVTTVRAGDIPYFNGSGLPAILSGNNTGTQCLQESSAGVPAWGSCGSTFYVLPASFGAVCDGVTNDAVALQNMINASAGQTILIPNVTCVTGTQLTLIANTTIIGASRDGSVIKGTMPATPVFLATNVSNITLNNFTIAGSNATVSWSTGTVGAFQFAQNSSAVAPNSDISLTGMRFRDFNAAFWVYFGTQTSTQSVSNVTFSNNVIVTTAANVPTDATVSNDNNYGLVFFGGTGGGGQFQKTRIMNNNWEAGALCFPTIIFANTTQTEIVANVINNNGRTTPGHCVNGLGTSWNTYGISIYDLNADGNPSTQWVISENIITNPYATGIYIVGDVSPALSDCKGCIIANNSIYGQGQQDANPRGGIVVSSTNNVNVINNTLMEGYGGVVISGQIQGAVLVEGNNCRSAVPYVSGALRPSCLNLAGSGITAPSAKVYVYNNTFENTGATSSTVLSNTATANRYGTLDIAGNTIINSGGFNTMDLGGSFVNTALLIRNNAITGSINFTSITGSVTLGGNTGTALTVATLPAATNGSSAFVSDGTTASSPCTASGTGSTAFRQNSAWKCF